MLKCTIVHSALNKTKTHSSIISHKHRRDQLKYVNTANPLFQDDTSPKPSTEDSTVISDVSANNDTSSVGITKRNLTAFKAECLTDEVKEIIGEDVESISESEIAGIKTVMYQWTASDEHWGQAT